MNRRFALLMMAAFALAACNGRDAGNSSGTAAKPATHTYENNPDPFPALTLTPELVVCPPNLCALHGPPIYIVRQIGNDLLIGGGLDDVIRVSANGKPVGKLGKRGRGPGEYLLPTAADVDDQGNLAILDQGNGFRVVHLDASGTHTGTITLPEATPPETALGFVVNGGKVYMLSGHNPANDADSLNFSLSLVSDDGKSMRPVVRARTSLGFNDNGKGMPRHLFQPYPMVALHRNGDMYVADGSEYSIRKLDPAGKLLSTIVVKAQPLLVTQPEVDAQLSVMKLDAKETMEAARSLPAVFPVISSIRVLSDETLWVRRYTRASTELARWDAFTADGKPLGTYTTSNIADIRGGTADRVLLIDRDSLDYPRIRWMTVKANAK